MKRKIIYGLFIAIFASLFIFFGVWGIPNCPECKSTATAVEPTSTEVIPIYTPTKTIEIVLSTETAEPTERINPTPSPDPYPAPTGTVTSITVEEEEEKAKELPPTGIKEDLEKFYKENVTIASLISLATLFMFLFIITRIIRSKINNS